jgi:hypothetical protein
MEEIHNTEAIRELLMGAFGDGELIDFCQSYFYEVYNSFGQNWGKGRKVQKLIDYCRRRNRMDELLARVREARPEKYAEFESRLPAAPSLPSVPEIPPQEVPAGQSRESGAFSESR